MRGMLRQVLAKDAKVLAKELESFERFVRVSKEQRHDTLQNENFLKTLGIEFWVDAPGLHNACSDVFELTWKENSLEYEKIKSYLKN